jgi:hypothetical protein
MENIERYKELLKLYNNCSECEIIKSKCGLCKAIDFINDKKYFDACYYLMFDKEFEIIDYILFNLIPHKTKNFSDLLIKFGIDNKNLKYLEFASLNRNITEAHLELGEIYEKNLEKDKAIYSYKKYLFNSIINHNDYIDNILDYDFRISEVKDDIIKYLFMDYINIESEIDNFFKKGFCDENNIFNVIKNIKWFISQYNKDWFDTIDDFIYFYRKNEKFESIYIECFEKILIKAENNFFDKQLNIEKYNEGCKALGYIFYENNNYEKAKLYYKKANNYFGLLKIYKNEIDLDNIKKYSLESLESGEYEICKDLAIYNIRGTYGFNKDSNKAFVYINILYKNQISFGEELFYLVESIIKNDIVYSNELEKTIFEFLLDKIEPRINIIKKIMRQDRCPILLSLALIYKKKSTIDNDYYLLYSYLAKNHLNKDYMDEFEEYLSNEYFSNENLN